MTRTQTPSTPRRLVRLLISAVIVLPTAFATLSPVWAAPTQEEVEDARAAVERLGHELETANEDYNEASYLLDEAKQQLADAKARMDAAQAEAEAARAQLSDRAVEAYTGMGSHLDGLLEAQDFSQFSDRLTFMGAIAENDAAIAANAEAAGQKAEWAAQEYDAAVAKAEGYLAKMAEQRQLFEDKLAEQEALYQELNEDYQEYQDFLAAQRAAAEAAAEAERQALQSTPAPDPGPIPDPPDPNLSGAAAAVAAARNALGAPYVFGAAGPSAFDCSGLTSWAWAQAGVSIPHSASAQYAVLPRVSLSAVQEGDIIYYGNFGPHVALYIGGGMIIHARHPGPGGQVQINSMYGYDRPYGAVRPG